MIRKEKLPEIQLNETGVFVNIQTILHEKHFTVNHNLFMSNYTGSRHE